MSKWISPVLMILGAIATAVSGDVQGYLAAHGTVAAIVVGLWGILAHFMPSPTAK